MSKQRQQRYEVRVQMIYNDDATGRADAPQYETFIVNATSTVDAKERGETAASIKYPSEYNEFDAIAAGLAGD